MTTFLRLMLEGALVLYGLAVLLFLIALAVAVVGDRKRRRNRPPRPGMSDREDALFARWERDLKGGKA
jgi:hypothetical protein